MELNLDEEYYNKYIKYKQRYLMLKQLKNNNELEGGAWPWPLSMIFGSSEVVAEEPKPEQPQGPVLGDEMFLVYTISTADLQNPLKLTQYENLSSKGAVLRTMKKIKDTNSNNVESNENEADQTTNIEPENENNENNNKEKVFMNCTDFFKTYTDAYLLFKEDGIWKSRYIDKDTNTMTFTYEDILAYTKSLDPKTSGTQKFPFESNNSQTANDNIINFINSEYTNYIEKSDKNLIPILDEFKKIIEIDPKISILQQYKSEQLSLALDPILYKPLKEGDTYLGKFNEEFKLSGEGKIKNMIMQIKPYKNADVEFRYDKLSDITAYNQTYLDINSIISAKQSQELKDRTAMLAEKQRRLDEARELSRQKTEEQKIKSQTQPR